MKVLERLSQIYKCTWWSLLKKASLLAQLVKNLPAMQETQVRFLGQEDPLKKEMATHSSILAWRIPWTEDPGRLQSMRVTRVRHNLVTKTPPSLGYKDSAHVSFLKKFPFSFFNRL